MDISIYKLGIPTLINNTEIIGYCTWPIYDDLNYRYQSSKRLHK